jgi:hypothetical protein
MLWRFLVRKYFWLGLLFWMGWLFATSIGDINEDPMIFLAAMVCAYFLIKWHGPAPVDNPQFANLTDKKLHAVIEEHQGNLYLFDKDKHKFIMQARTFEECEKFLSEQYKNTLIVITSEDKKLIKKLKGTV